MTTKYTRLRSRKGGRFRLLRTIVKRRVIWGETYVLLYGRKCVIPSFFLLASRKKQTRNGRSWSSFFITHICALIAINSSRAYLFYYDVLLIPQEKQTHHHRSTHPSTTSSVLDWTNINKNNIYTMKNVSIVLIALAGLVASSGT